MKQSVTRLARVRLGIAAAVMAMGTAGGALVALHLPVAQAAPKPFEVVDTTIEEVQAEYKAGRLTAHALVKAYLDRIEAYDKNGPKINAVITLSLIHI